MAEEVGTKVRSSSKRCAIRTGPGVVAYTYNRITSTGKGMLVSFKAAWTTQQDFV